MPHGEFVNLKNSDLKTLGEFLFYDIDNLSPNQLNIVKSSLINSGANIVYISPGGKGLHFLVRVSGLTVDNFTSVYECIRDYFLGLGFDIDMSAGGLNRKVYLSTDNELIIGDGIWSINDGTIVKGNIKIDLNKKQREGGEI